MKPLPNSKQYSLLLSWITVVFLLILQCIIPEAVADDAHKIKLVTLKNRAAAEILTAIQPHLPEGTVASQSDQKIVMSGKASNLEQLEILINALDQPTQAWRVFFAQGQINLQETQQKNTRHYSTAPSELFEVLVREGVQAKLERGFWIPVKVNHGRYPETGYEWISSGFWVTVQPIGGELVLNLSTQQAKPNKKNLSPQANFQQPSFTASQFESEIALKQGQWTTLGSEAQLAAQIPDTSRRYYGGSMNEYYSICIESSRLASCPR